MLRFLDPLRDTENYTFWFTSIENPLELEKNQHLLEKAYKLSLTSNEDAFTTFYGKLLKSKNADKFTLATIFVAYNEDLKFDKFEVLEIQRKPFEYTEE